MSNFQYALMIGISIFILGGLLAGMDVDAPSYQDAVDETDALFTTDIGVIGDLNSTSRTVLQRDSVTAEYRSPNITKEMPDSITVSKGSFSKGETSLTSFTAQDPSAAYLEFTVTEATRDGDLKIMLNGGEERSFQPEQGQTYTIKLENYTAGENKLFFAADKSGLAIWRPTHYHLEDISLTVTDEAVAKNTMPFRVYPYETTGFDTGEVSYFVTEDVQASSPMIIEINGNQVDTRAPAKRSLPYSFDFSKEETDLHPGENTISVYTQPGSTYQLSNVKIDLRFYTSTERRTVQESFTIPLYRYRVLTGGGIIRFNVDRIGVQEPVELTLNDRTYEITPDAGQNTLEFSKDDVSSGENTISISTAGNYEITDLSILAGQ